MKDLKSIDQLIFDAQDCLDRASMATDIQRQNTLTQVALGYMALARLRSDNPRPPQHKGGIPDSAYGKSWA